MIVLALVLALGFAMPEAIGASLLVTTINVVVAPPCALPETVGCGPSLSANSLVHSSR